MCGIYCLATSRLLPNPFLGKHSQTGTTTSTTGAMDASCAIEGNADMYGLGIRLGFYLQWLASVLANLLMTKAEIHTTRFAMNTYTSAVFVALVVQITRGTATALDTYIVLLLCFGSHYSMVPIFLWRAMTGFDARWDPTRWTIVRSSLPLRVFSTVVITAVAVLQILFWTQAVATKENGMGRGCLQYGFVFRPVPLRDREIMAINVAFSGATLLIAVLSWADWVVAREGEFLKQERVAWQPRRKRLLQLRCLVTTIVAAAVITATELSISWNRIWNVNGLDSAGQLVSLILGFVVLARVLWTYMTDGPDIPSSEAGSVYVSHALPFRLHQTV